MSKGGGKNDGKRGKKGYGVDPDAQASREKDAEDRLRARKEAWKLREREKEREKVWAKREEEKKREDQKNKDRERDARRDRERDRERDSDWGGREFRRESNDKWDRSSRKDERSTNKKDRATKSMSPKVTLTKGPNAFSNHSPARIPLEILSPRASERPLKTSSCDFKSNLKSTFNPQSTIKERVKEKEREAVRKREMAKEIEKKEALFSSTAINRVKSKMESKKKGSEEVFENELLSNRDSHYGQSKPWSKKPPWRLTKEEKKARCINEIDVDLKHINSQTKREIPLAEDVVTQAARNAERRKAKLMGMSAENKKRSDSIERRRQDNARRRDNNISNVPDTSAANGKLDLGEKRDNAEKANLPLSRKASSKNVDGDLVSSENAFSLSENLSSSQAHHGVSSKQSGAFESDSKNAMDANKNPFAPDVGSDLSSDYDEYVNDTRPKANYPIRRRGEAAASSDNDENVYANGDACDNENPFADEINTDDRFVVDEINPFAVVDDLSKLLSNDTPIMSKTALSKNSLAHIEENIDEILKSEGVDVGFNDGVVALKNQDLDDQGLDGIDHFDDPFDAQVVDKSLGNERGRDRSRSRHRDSSDLSNNQGKSRPGPNALSENERKRLREQEKREKDEMEKKRAAERKKQRAIYLEQEKHVKWVTTMTNEDILKEREDFLKLNPKDQKNGRPNGKTKWEMLSGEEKRQYGITFSWALRHCDWISEMDSRGFVPFTVMQQKLRENQQEELTFAEIIDMVKGDAKQRMSLIEEKCVLKDGSDAMILSASGESLLPWELNVPVKKIRANQGHSIPNIKMENRVLTLEDLGKNAANVGRIPGLSSSPGTDLSVIAHGTDRDAWKLIRKDGFLKRMNRTHVHFAQVEEDQNGGYRVAGDNKEYNSRVEEEDSVIEPPTKRRRRDGLAEISGIRRSATVIIFVNARKMIEDGESLELSANGVILSTGPVYRKWWKEVVDRDSGLALDMGKD